MLFLEIIKHFCLKYVLKHKKANFSKNGIQKALLYHKKVLPLKAINLVNKNIEP